MAEAVREEDGPQLLIDQFLQRYVLLQDVQLLQPFEYGSFCERVHVLPVDSRPQRRHHLVSRLQHDVIDLGLLLQKHSVDRVAHRDVRHVPFVLPPHVVQHQLILLQCLVVHDVVQNRRVLAPRTDRLVSENAITVIFDVGLENGC